METISVQCESSVVLSERINKIIALIPRPFYGEHGSNWEGIAVHKLTSVRHSIKFTAPTAMDTRWNEVGEILNLYISTQKGRWVDEIEKIFSEEF